MLMYERGPFQEVFLFCLRRCFTQARLSHGLEWTALLPSWCPLQHWQPLQHRISGVLWLKACEGVPRTAQTTWRGICSFKSFYGNPTHTGLAGLWLSRVVAQCPRPFLALWWAAELCWLLIIWIWGVRVEGASTSVLRSLFLSLSSFGLSLLVPCCWPKCHKLAFF